MKTKFRVPRSTFTRRNAYRMKHVFDECLTNQKSVFIPLADSGYTLMTIRQKLMDALLWLMEHYEEEGEFKRSDYQHLKLFSKICVKEDGILVDYRRTVLNIVIEEDDSDDQIVDKNGKKVNWKNDLTAFIKNNDITTPLHIKNLDLSVEDQNWIKHYLGTIDGVEFSISKEEIKVIK